MKIKKMGITALMSGILMIMPAMSAFAAEVPKTNENVYIQGEISNESAETIPIAEMYLLSRASTVTHHSTVSPKYGTLSGCTLSGTCYATLDGSKVSASYSATSTFYHSNGDKLVGSAKSGNSTSSTDFTWTSQDDSSGSYYTTSTSTDTTCSKSGYETVHITNKTENPR